MVKIVKENPYSSVILNYLDRFTRIWMSLVKVSFDRTFYVFCSTTQEKRRPYLLLHRYVLVFPLALLSFILTVPLGLLAFLVWVTFQHKRKPYLFSRTDDLLIGNDKSVGKGLPEEFSFMTSNICLLPECFSRYNNLSHTGWRAKQIGKILAGTVNPVSPLGPAYTSNGNVMGDVENPNILLSAAVPNYDDSYAKMSKNGHWPTHDVNHNGNILASHSILPPSTTLSMTKTPKFSTSALASMPDVDFLFLQEASWELSYAESLAKELHRKFPYVIYDIGAYTLSGNLYVGNSGLMLASKYPVQDIRFSVYPPGISQCRFASKGLLQVKVITTALQCERKCECSLYNFYCTSGNVHKN